MGKRGADAAHQALLLDILGSDECVFARLDTGCFDDKDGDCIALGDRRRDRAFVIDADRHVAAGAAVHADRDRLFHTQ